MFWIVLPFAAIGAAIVAFFLACIVSETVRAVRQSRRVAAVAVRHATGRRRITAREWWYGFKREWFSGYSSLVIGFVEIPRNPDEPLRGRL